MVIDNNYLSKEPQVIILDLDGTIIGDITSQLLLYEMSKIKDLHLKFNKKILKEKLKKGLIRKNFKFFIDSLKHAEFFIYTAAENKWALYIIKCIEELLNITFNKPIFTRKHCLIEKNIIKKDINQIKEKIIQTLSKKYNIKNYSDIFNLIIIENTPNVYISYNDNLLICNTYTFRVIENIPCYFTEKIYNKNYNKINEIINKYYFININSDNFYDFQKQFYIFYIKYIDYVKKRNIKDDFFGNLTKLLISKSIKEFNLKSIDYIREKIQY